MRIRASRTTVFVPSGQGFLAFNFLAKSTFSCNSETLCLLSKLFEWKDISWILEEYSEFSADSIENQILNLIKLRALTVDGDEHNRVEEEYLSTWEWGLVSGILHFSLQDCRFISNTDAVVLQKIRAEHDPSPRLYTTNVNYRETVSLPNAQEDSEFVNLVCERRTNRECKTDEIELHELSECLHSGLRIVEIMETETGPLPRSVTPSGGARNPYEAFVYARNVRGLKAGCYHYSAIEHSLGQLDTHSMPEPSLLLGDQDWANVMPCIIFLVANFERTMWKYPDNNAYRVVLIEAGHIGQNIMLAATRHGLSACPTSAINDSAVNSFLGITKLTHNAVYALALGRPGT